METKLTHFHWLLYTDRLSNQKPYTGVCELWNYITGSNMLALERSHRFCVKFSQKLPPSAKNDISLFSLGVCSIESVIDYKKLQLLGQLCRLPCYYLAKKIFVYRLIHYSGGTGRQSLGFRPDMYRLLTKYNLSHFISEFIENGCFLTKNAWNTVLNRQLFLQDYWQMVKLIALR